MFIFVLPTKNAYVLVVLFLTCFQNFVNQSELEKTETLVLL